MLLEGKKTIIAQKIRQRVRKFLFLTIYVMALPFVILNVSQSVFTSTMMGMKALINLYTEFQDTRLEDKSQSPASRNHECIYPRV